MAKQSQFDRAKASIEAQIRELQRSLDLLNEHGAERNGSAGPKRTRGPKAAKQSVASKAATDAVGF